MVPEKEGGKLKLTPVTRQLQAAQGAILGVQDAQILNNARKRLSNRKCQHTGS